jgi:predicted NBD/HSP70 family sugar kinase
VGTSFVDYRGRGFWTRDAALETVLALLATELERSADGDEAASAVLDHWALQAVAGFNGCVNADLDRSLTDGRLTSDITGALGRIRARLPAQGLVEADDPRFLRRAERVSAAGPWRPPSALASWVNEVLKALGDLVEGRLPALPDGYWFVGGDGRHVHASR